jgi:hypothetical protein
VTLTVLPDGALVATGSTPSGQLIDLQQTSPASGVAVTGCASGSDGRTGSTTQVSCKAAAGAEQCTADVRADSGSASPTGTVQFAVVAGAKGTVVGSTSATCKLAAAGTAGSSGCGVQYSPGGRRERSAAGLRHVPG